MAKKNSTLENEFPTEGAATEGTVAENTAAGTTPAAEGEINTNLPEDTEKAKEDAKTYKMLDGTDGSRAAFIREQFVTVGKTRKEIADANGFDYRVVYSATVNLSNGSEGGSRGRSPSNATIQVTEDGKYVKVENTTVKNEAGEEAPAVTVTVDGEILPEGAEVPATTSISRNDWIVSQVKAGADRGKIAKLLDLSYGVVYGLTKEEGGSRASHKVELEDGTIVTRAVYIRMLFAAGKTRSDIAKELDVDYTIVWQATKTEKTEAEKLGEIVETLKALVEHIVDKDAFNAAIAVIETAEIIVPAEEPATETPAENTENAPEASVEAPADAQ